MSKSIIDKFIILKLDNGIKGYYFQAHNAEGAATHCGYSGLSPEQAKSAQVVARYSGTDAAKAMWDWQFEELSANKQTLIKVVFPEISTADKTTLKKPYELASLAYAKAMKVINETCPRCGGMGWYPSSIADGVCYRCYGRGKPPITPKLLKELSKYFSGGADPEVKTVCIPACENHEGLHSISVKLQWICPVCGKPRGKIENGKSYDGSLCLMCDTWKNPCGHVDKYDSVRQEAQTNDLNGGGGR